jgi:HSP20 family molecular chaperone IbpA
MDYAEPEGAMMKNQRNYLDLGAIFDEIFGAAEDFRDEFQRNFKGFEGRHFGHDPFVKYSFDENTDYYPAYSYPPMNAFMSADKSLTFEFALAGFDEKNISLSFQGDYMVFSARLGDADGEPGIDGPDADVHYFKRRLKFRDIEKQKYFVPQDKYAQENVKAVFRNGILRVTVPPKDQVDQSDGIRIEIVKEGN